MFSRLGQLHSPESRVEMTVHAGVVVKGKEEVVFTIFRCSQKVLRSRLKLLEEIKPQSQTCLSPIKKNPKHKMLHQDATPYRGSNLCNYSFLY